VTATSSSSDPNSCGAPLVETGPFHVAVRKAETVVILDLSGKLAAGFGDDLLRDTLGELFSEGWKKVLVNLTKVPFIDSAGLGELVAALRRAQREGARLKLLNKAGRVQETLYVSRLLPLFEVFETEDAALASFN
jgi:anti-sigma B factor antagonist